MKRAFRTSLFLLAALLLLTACAAVFASAADAAVYYYIDSERGADNVSGRDPAKPLRTWSEACKNAVRDGAALLLNGKIEVTDFTEPAHTAPVIVRGADKDAALTLQGTLRDGSGITAASLGAAAALFETDSARVV